MARVGIGLAARAAGGRIVRIAVVGCGHVGLVTAACLASLGHEVRGLDVDAERVADLSAGRVPFHEPALEELLASGLAGSRLSFSVDPRSAVRGAAVVMIAVGTPPMPDGSPDVTQLSEAVSAVAPHLSTDTVVVTRSTVPVGSGDWVSMRLEDAASPGWNGGIVAAPEFLREGSAVGDFLHPDRIVLGGDPHDVDVVERVFEPLLTGGSVPVLRMDRASAEMVKYAANAALAAKISFANEIAQLCDRTGADARLVLPAVGADPRVAPAFLNPGLGWGGSCFPKDVSALLATARQHGQDAPLLRAIVEVNDDALASGLSKLRDGLVRLSGRRIAIIGLAFKHGTDDLRASPPLALADALHAAGAGVSAYDPLVRDVPDRPWLRLADDVTSAARDADALVLAPAAPRDLDVAGLLRAARGRFVLDASGGASSERLRRSGFDVVGMGWPARSTSRRVEFLRSVAG